jgi:hypothetical protein
MGGCDVHESLRRSESEIISNPRILSHPKERCNLLEIFTMGGHLFS